MKKALSIAAALGLAAMMSVSASAAPKPSIEDPLGDANFVNDQGSGDGSFGDFNQADAGTVSDIVAVTFWNDAKNLYVSVETEAAPPAATGIGYRVRVNPDGAGGAYCLAFEVYHPGANNALTAPVGYLRDTCAGGDPVPIKIVGTQWEIPRSANEAFAKGKKLVAPQAQAFLYSGNESAGSTYPVADTTKVGTDFAFKK
jgi:hypothetical protein